MFPDLHPSSCFRPPPPPPPPVPALRTRTNKRLSQFLETESKTADFVAVINDLRDFVYGQPPSLSLTTLLDQLKVRPVCISRLAAVFFL